jgi:hypothetical protein
MTKIAGGQQIAATKRLGSAADEHAIHDDLAAGGKILGDKLVFLLDIRKQHVLVAGKMDGFALAQVRERYESIVSRIKPQNAALCCSVF